MTSIDNRTPFACAGQFVRDHLGRSYWIVATRATFSFDREGRLRLAAEQTPVHPVPEYFGDPLSSPLKYGGDLVPMRAATDLILHAKAYAPSDRPVTKTEVGFTLGSAHKRLTATGPRYFEWALKGPVLSQPEPFTETSISYHLTWGGTCMDARGEPVQDPKNPLGKGWAFDATRLIGKEGPRLYQTDALGQELEQAVGFGPIPPSWQPRAQHAGTYDEAWHQYTLPQLPADFNPAYYQDAPADQQFTPPLEGGERLNLLGMTPEGSLVLTLPRLAFTCKAHVHDRTTEALSMLSSVVVLTEEQHLVMVWHCAWPCKETEAISTRIEAQGTEAFL